MRTTNTRSVIDFGKRVDELLHLVEGPVEIVVRRRARRARSTAVAGLRRAPNTWPSVMKPASTRLSSTTLARARAAGRLMCGANLRRRLEQAGEHRGFGEVHVARGLVEVVLRRRVDAEGAAAHIGAVEIELEDLVLGEPRLEPDREERLLDLALDGALVGQEQVLGELLRDRGAALHHAAGARVGQRARGTCRAGRCRNARRSAGPRSRAPP